MAQTRAGLLLVIGDSRAHRTLPWRRTKDGGWINQPTWE